MLLPMCNLVGAIGLSLKPRANDFPDVLSKPKVCGDVAGPTPALTVDARTLALTAGVARPELGSARASKLRGGHPR